MSIFGLVIGTAHTFVRSPTNPMATANPSIEHNTLVHSTHSWRWPDLGMAVSLMLPQQSQACIGAAHSRSGTQGHTVAHPPTGIGAADL